MCNLGWSVLFCKTHCLRPRSWQWDRQMSSDGSWSMKLCCLWCGAHGPTEHLGHTTIFSLLNAKERRWWLKVMTAVKKCTVASNMPRAALPRTTTPCSARNMPVESCLFSFLFSYLKKKSAKYKTSAVWMLVCIQWDSHPLVWLVQSLEQTLRSLLQKVTCASVFQLWNASFPTQAVRLGAFSGGGRERGRDLFIQVSVKLLLTCDTVQGLLALPGG